jgi:hypothetical protein
VQQYQTVAQWAAFAKLGDINGDGYIDNKDLVLLQAAYGSRPGDSNWNPRADLNGDGVVDLADLVILSHNMGLNIWSYYGIPKPFPKWVLYAIAGGAAVAATAGITYYALKRVH